MFLDTLFCYSIDARTFIDAIVQKEKYGIHVEHFLFYVDNSQCCLNQKKIIKSQNSGVSERESPVSTIN